jgi:hypothetical protein
MVSSMSFEDGSELTTHIAGIAGNLADDIAFEFNVVAGLIQRHSHSAPGPLRRNHQWQTDVAGVLSGHDFSTATLADAPFGRARSVDDPLEFATTREA